MTTMITNLQRAGWAHNALDYFIQQTRTDNQGSSEYCFVPPLAFGVYSPRGDEARIAVGLCGLKMLKLRPVVLI